jgi:imidazolonepropionase-like amidohydrolase
MAAAKKYNITVCGHALGNIPATKVLASGYKSIEHVGYFDKAKTPEQLDSLLTLAAKHKVYICPTLDWSMMVYHTIPKDNLTYRSGYQIGNHLYENTWKKAYAETSQTILGNEEKYKNIFRTQLATKLNVLKLAKNKGIKIIAGSDAEEPYQTPGYSLIEELKWIQKAGFTNKELLQMVTTNAEAFLKEIGIEIKPAYIILDKNPLEDINNLNTVTGILKGGKLVYAEDYFRDFSIQKK